MFNKSIIKTISWLLVIIWMFIIFILSNSPANVSGKDSSNIIKNTIEITLNITNKIGITNYHPTIKELNETSLSLNEPLREAMHGFVYFILALLLLIALQHSNVNKLYVIAIITCIIYAFSDEIHQIFIDGRAFELFDIFIDTVGSLIGTLLYRFIYKLRYKY